MTERSNGQDGAEALSHCIPEHGKTMTIEAPQLVGLLYEMKEGLDAVRSKVQALTEKVKENCFPTADGISYLEAKHLLLLSYCQSIVYYLLRKAKGLSVDGHPVIRSLVEIRLFLEKIRPIDKKIQYQVQKLTKVGDSAVAKSAYDGKEKDASVNNEDPLKYKPNPDMLVSKLDQATQDAEGVYRPPMFAPTSIDDGKSSKEKRLALRKEKQALRQASQSAFVKEFVDELEGRPEEVKEIIGSESKELRRMKARMEERAQQEEELFTRVPLSKMEKKKLKHVKRSRNGLLGLSEDFYDDISGFVAAENGNMHTTENSGRGGKKFKGQKGKRHANRG